MNRATDAYNRLIERFGPQGWWPADTPFEMIVGAMLTHQTSWKKVEVAIGNLKRAGLLSPAGIARTSLNDLALLVRPAGMYRTKPKRLRDLSRHIMQASMGDIDAFLGRDADLLREELLSLDGIGPETADSILLYAANVPVFVVDAYTRRIGKRVGLFRSDDYREIQAYFERNLKPDVGVYQEYHALIVELGKSHCRSSPVCEECPLAGVCEHARSAVEMDLIGDRDDRPKRRSQSPK